MIKNGPSSIQQFQLEKTIKRISVDFRSPFLLYLTPQAFHLYHMNKLIPLFQMQVFSDISQITNIAQFHKKTIFSVDSFIFLNDKKIFAHKDDINNMICDQFGLILSSSRDRTVSLVSALKQQIVGSVTALNWHRSLSITGDSVGQTYLWDINKCSRIAQRKIHSQSVDIIGNYVDYSMTNLYFTVSKDERRMVFSDLRTNRNVQIINGLPLHLKNTIANESGRVFVVDQQNASVFDICSGFKKIAVFEPQTDEENWDKTFKKKYLNRKINQILTYNQYLIFGCSNGHIQVYNSDKLTFEYGVQLTKEGNSIKSLSLSEGKDIVCLSEDGRVYRANFQQDNKNRGLI